MLFCVDWIGVTKAALGSLTLSAGLLCTPVNSLIEPMPRGSPVSPPEHTSYCGGGLFISGSSVTISKMYRDDREFFCTRVTLWEML